MAIVLQSPRVLVIPLTEALLELQINDPAGLVGTLGYSIRLPDEASPELVYALGKMACSVKQAPHLWPWNTNWAIISRQAQAYIGGIDFHGAPDATGQVELGYGLDADYRHKGYMDEALRLMVGWAFSHPEVRVIKAETALNNLPSQQVLQRAGFCPVQVAGTNLWWQMDRLSCAGG